MIGDKVEIFVNGTDFSRIKTGCILEDEIIRRLGHDVERSHVAKAYCPKI